MKIFRDFFFINFSFRQVMPRVSYLKALDIWLAVCFMIVFLSLIKLAIMKYRNITVPRAWILYSTQCHIPVLSTDTCASGFA